MVRWRNARQTDLGILSPVVRSSVPSSVRSIDGPITACLTSSHGVKSRQPTACNLAGG